MVEPKYTRRPGLGSLATLSFAVLLSFNSFVRSVQAKATNTIAGTEPKTVVDLGYASYEGTFDEASNTVEWLGIRFAEPPTGSLRWRKPKEPKSIQCEDANNGILKADTYPPRCIIAPSVVGLSDSSPLRNVSTTGNTTGDDLRKRQLPIPVPTDNTSEDCLFLNVASPVRKEKNPSLPVVVWIHGGGYQIGGASGIIGLDLQDGKQLIRQSGGNVVTVVIQYRLGMFGFLAGEEVKKDGVLNVGLWDQEFALQWVQKYISRFGGDPSQVTIWGESAGAGSVLLHTIAHGGNTYPSLFRTAITSSVYLPSVHPYQHSIPEKIFREVVERTNCAKPESGSQLDCLRDIPVDTLAEVNNVIISEQFFGTFIFTPVMDGDFIKRRPYELLREGKTNTDLLLAVTNLVEGAVFVNPNATTLTVNEYIANLFPALDDRAIERAASLYNQSGGGVIEQSIAVMTESIFICPTIVLLESWRGKSYKAEFAIPPSNHGDDVGYYLPSPVLPPIFNNTEFVNAFAQSFMNFAMSSDPNVKWTENIVPMWNEWSNKKRVDMRFGRTDSDVEAGIPEPDVRAIRTSKELIDRCCVWESLGSFTHQ